MRRIRFARVGLALVAACTTWAAGVSNASAQTAAQAADYCNNSNNQYGAELQIGGCTSLIQNLWVDTAQMPTVFGRRGNAYYAQRDYARAIADYDQAIRLNPQFANAFVGRGLAYYAQGDYVRAIADYDQAIQLNPHNADTFLKRGAAYYNQRDYTRAIADYDQAIRLNPQFADAFFNRGMAFRAQSDNARAIADYDQAIRLNPQYAEALEMRAYTYLMGQQDYPRALADYDALVRLRPDANSLIGRGVAYARLGDDVRAVGDYDRAIAVSPEAELAFFNRASARFRQQRYEEARADYNRAFELGFNHARYGRGAALFRLGRTVEGQTDIDAATAIEPDVAAAYADKGVTP